MSKSDIRCPACPSKTKQRIGSIVNTDPNSIVKMSIKSLKGAMANFETKCPKCGSLIYINIFWDNKQFNNKV